jgi:hypothetical protein
MEVYNSANSPTTYIQSYITVISEIRRGLLLFFILFSGLSALEKCFLGRLSDKVVC